jgi:hypothetical protein
VLAGLNGLKAWDIVIPLAFRAGQFLVIITGDKALVARHTKKCFRIGIFSRALRAVVRLHPWDSVFCSMPTGGTTIFGKRRENSANSTTLKTMNGWPKSLFVAFKAFMRRYFSKGWFSEDLSAVGADIVHFETATPRGAKREI